MQKIWSSRRGTTELGGNLLNYTPRGSSESSRLILARAARNTLAGCQGCIEVGRKLLSSTLHSSDCEAFELCSRFSKFRRLRRFSICSNFVEVFKNSNVWICWGMWRCWEEVERKTDALLQEFCKVSGFCLKFSKFQRFQNVCKFLEVFKNLNVWICWGMWRYWEEVDRKTDALLQDFCKISGCCLKFLQVSKISKRVKISKF